MAALITLFRFLILRQLLFLLIFYYICAGKRTRCGKGQESQNKRIHRVGVINKAGKQGPKYSAEGGHGVVKSHYAVAVLRGGAHCGKVLQKRQPHNVKCEERDIDHNKRYKTVCKEYQAEARGTAEHNWQKADICVCFPQHPHAYCAVKDKAYHRYDGFKYAVIHGA